MKNTNKNKTTKKLPVPGKVKKGFRLYWRRSFGSRLYSLLLGNGLCRRRPDYRCKQFE